MALSPNNVQDDKRISNLKAREEESFVQLMAQKIGYPYIDLLTVGIETDALRLISQTEAKNAKIAAFKLTGKSLLVGVQSSENILAREAIETLKKAGYQITSYLVSSRSLEKAWERYADINMTSEADSFLAISPETLQDLAKRIHSNDEIEKEIEATLSSESVHAVTKVLEVIFGGAIATDSSDIHVEPYEDHVRLRFRQDGLLQDITKLTHPVYKKLVSRIKLLSELKISQTEEAQDGRFTIKYEGVDIEVRTSIVPSAYGEGIVMRLLNPNTTKVGFDKLGIEPKLFKILDQEIKKPNGMILNTGPTGSGKTTTLYSFLRRVYNPEVKIMTIEDPIEYHIEGISQTQVEHERGYDFLAGLRAALRQDPDIIMIGEIRDNETAKIAVNSALTGHLVLSTLHTNNAAGAIPRLLDLGVNPKILGSALTVVMAQRLVRTLCPFCKKKTSVNPEQEQLLRSVLTHAHEAGKDLAAYGVTVDQAIEIYEPTGCEKCNGEGYKGRIGIFEAILMDEAIEDIMINNPNEHEIMRAAEPQGILTLSEDGVMKILAGITSIEEVTKVVDLSQSSGTGRAGAATPSAAATNPSAPALTNDTLPPRPHGHSPLTGREISSRASEITLLTDYLKELEADQMTNPNRGIADKITKIKNVLITLLKETPADELFPIASEQQRVHSEVEKMMNELQELERHQNENPTVGVADKIQTIRMMIENLRT